MHIAFCTTGDLASVRKNERANLHSDVATATPTQRRGADEAIVQYEIRGRNCDGPDVLVQAPGGNATTVRDCNRIVRCQGDAAATGFRLSAALNDGAACYRDCLRLD